jgi:hypothetical protein
MVWSRSKPPQGECTPNQPAVERRPSLFEDEPDPLLEGIGITGDLARAMDDGLEGQEPRWKLFGPTFPEYIVHIGFSRSCP